MAEGDHPVAEGLNGRHFVFQQALGAPVIMEAAAGDPAHAPEAADPDVAFAVEKKSRRAFGDEAVSDSQRVGAGAGRIIIEDGDRISEKEPALFVG